MRPIKEIMREKGQCRRKPGENIITGFHGLAAVYDGPQKEKLRGPEPWWALAGRVR
jgi:hypothetical protein